jgi:DNA (cytosine-5)-methyltransferase 1
LQEQSKPRLLDLFCGAGGAARGYQRAGFYVVGVDIAPQPRYAGDEFIQADAMTFPLDGFDVIHASPPCQAYTLAQRIQKRTHPDLVAPIRERLRVAHLPYVIENVPGAPLLNHVTVCGLFFGLGVERHRWFESRFKLEGTTCPGSVPMTKMGRPPTEGKIMQVVGHFSGVKQARLAMGIDWMNRDELAEAIPPAYTEYIGRQLIEVLV